MRFNLYAGEFKDAGPIGGSRRLVAVTSQKGLGHSDRAKKPRFVGPLRLLEVTKVFDDADGYGVMRIPSRIFGQRLAVLVVRYTREPTSFSVPAPSDVPVNATVLFTKYPASVQKLCGLTEKEAWKLNGVPVEQVAWEESGVPSYVGRIRKKTSFFFILNRRF